MNILLFELAFVALTSAAVFAIDRLQPRPQMSFDTRLEKLVAPKKVTLERGSYRDAALPEEPQARPPSFLERWRAQRQARRQLAYERRLEAVLRERERER